jgi:hypothetical protein
MKGGCIKWCMNLVKHYALWNKLLNIQLHAFPPILALKQIVGLTYVSHTDMAMASSLNI